MRPLGFALILLVLLTGTTGCMISTQEGERTHVNSAAPDEIVFHFDTSFNRTLLYGRSIALLGIGLWFFRTRNSGGNVLCMVLAVVFVSAAGGWYFTGQRKLTNYRVELAPTHRSLPMDARHRVARPIGSHADDFFSLTDPVVRRERRPRRGMRTRDSVSIDGDGMRINSQARNAVQVL